MKLLSPIITLRNILKNKNLIKHKSIISKSVILASTGVGGILVTNNATEGTVLPYVSAGIRFLRSLKICMLISFDYYFSTMGLNEELPNYKPMMSLIHKRAATKILEGCLVNGGTYIKLGQGLVSLSHILPSEYIEILTELQDQCLPHEYKEMVQIIQEDFGRHPFELFNSIDPKPIAAASLAQVYKGETINGDKVAIKVQYIDLQSRFVSDVATIGFLLKIIGFIHPDFNFDWVLKDLSCSLREELNFLNEGENAERCANDFKNYKFAYIPKVYWELSSSRFLVTEFVEAIKVNEIEKLNKAGFSLFDIDLKICELFAHQIFRTGFVHADPHPGNIFIRKSKSGSGAEIVIIDHGLYQEIEEATRLSLSEMWKAIVFNDSHKMKIYANLLGVNNYEILAQILTQRPVKVSGFKLTSRITEEQMAELTEAAKNRFDEIMQVLKVMPRSLILVVRNLNTIRSITHDHGDPIDRYAVLARCAVTSRHKSHNFVQIIKVMPHYIHLEFKILCGKIWIWCIKTYLKFLNILGRSPDANSLLAGLY